MDPMAVFKRFTGSFPLPSVIDESSYENLYSAANIAHQDLMSRELRKEIEKARPSCVFAHLAKQVNMRSQVMLDAAKLVT